MTQSPREATPEKERHAHAPDGYQVLPPLAEDEYQALKVDIAVRGILVPVELDEQGVVLDGHHRVRAARELGISTWPYVVRRGLSEEDKRSHARKLNLLRRHLAPEQKRAVIGEQLLETPRRSDRQIAAQLGVSNSTVSLVRRDMETAGELCEAHTSLGADGKVYPRPIKDLLPAIRLEEAGGNENMDPLLELPAGLAVHFSSAGSEWYTPAHIIKHVIATLGAIDLDPCSNSHTHPNVPAARHYTQADDGLNQPWAGRVYMNPLYGRDIEIWAEKLRSSYNTGAVLAAIALLPARTDTAWFRLLRDFPVCFLDGRLRFSGHTNSAPFPSAVFYLGSELQRFLRSFSDLGGIYRRLENAT